MKALYFSDQHKQIVMGRRKKEIKDSVKLMIVVACFLLAAMIERQT